MKKLANLFLVFGMMIASMFSFNVKAEDGMIILTEDMNESIVIEDDEEVILDLNGHTIYGQIINYGYLTIIDSVGTGKVVATDVPAVKTYSDMTIENGTFQSNVVCLEFAVDVEVNDWPFVDVYGGTFDCGNEFELLTIDPTIYDGFMVWEGNILISGGNFNKSIVENKVVYFHHDEYYVDGRYIIDQRCDLNLPNPNYGDSAYVQYHVGEVFKLETNPNVDYDIDFTWMTSDESIAKVSQDGTITAVGVGKVRICAASKNAIMWGEEDLDGFPWYGNIGEIEIIETILEAVALDKTETTINVDEETTLTATTTPSYAINATTLIWTSSDETVATVENGVVSGLKAGVTTITVSDGNGKSASCEVTVKETVANVPELDTTTPVEKPTAGVVGSETLNDVLLESANNAFASELEGAYLVSTDIVIEEVDASAIEDDANTVYALLKSTEGKNGKVLQYLDLSILVTADGNELGEVHETTEAIDFAIKLPAELLEDGVTYDVVRVHDGVAKYLNATLEGDVLHFSSDSFSTYALVALENIADVTPPTNPDIPSTSDSTETLVYVSMALVSTTTLLGFAIAKKKELENI